VQVSRNNPGLKKCKKVSYGLLDNTPESPAEPGVIPSITCDGRTVGSYCRYKTAAVRDAGEVDVPDQAGDGTAELFPRAVRE
jgi:hypothetical protein